MFWPLRERSIDTDMTSQDLRRRPEKKGIETDLKSVEKEVSWETFFLKEKGLPGHLAWTRFAFLKNAIVYESINLSLKPLKERPT